MLIFLKILIKKYITIKYRNVNFQNYLENNLKQNVCVTFKKLINLQY